MPKTKRTKKRKIEDDPKIKLTTKMKKTSKIKVPPKMRRATKRKTTPQKWMTQKLILPKNENDPAVQHWH